MLQPYKPSPVTLRAYIATYIALLVLATASWLFAGLPDGSALIVALGIAAIKAVLVLLFFMHLIEERFSYRFVMLIAVVLVGVFISLTVLDPLTRGPYPPGPSQNTRFRRAATD
jgi:cytochrome c oxidase subunit IV